MPPAAIHFRSDDVVLTMVNGKPSSHCIDMVKRASTFYSKKIQFVFTHGAHLHSDGIHVKSLCRLTWKNNQNACLTWAWGKRRQTS